MVWVTLIALMLMSIAVFVAAEYAHGIRTGEKRSLAAVGVAVVLFVTTLPLLVQHPPGDGGFERFIAVAMPAITGLACFWFTKLHIDRHRPLGGFLATVLGLAMFGLAFILWFGQPGPGAGGLAGVATGDSSPEERLRVQQKRLQEQLIALDERLLVTIPDGRRELRRQAGEVQRALTSASPAIRVQLENEVKEIARQMLAIDREEMRTRDLIERVKQEERRLARLFTSQNLTGELASIDADLDRLWQDTQQQINASLSGGASDVGAIGELELQAKMNELLQEGGSPPAPTGGNGG